MLTRLMLVAALAGSFASLPPMWAQGLSPRDLYLERAADSNGPSAEHHLGLRYSILLVDAPTGRFRDVAPTTVFHEGDCLAVEFTPNRNGDVYVLNHGSSGDWQLLIPDASAPGASAGAKAGVTLRIPANYCFRLDAKPGTETLVLAITEREEDAHKIRELLPAQSGNSGPAAAANANVNAVHEEVESWQRLCSRDLKLQTVVHPETAGERPNAVYAVTSSPAAADRLVVAIDIRHE
jgi:hypothetical protein